MLLLGVDRDNQEIAYIYDERRSVVLWALKRVVDAGRKHGITVSICGQAPSDYPELAQKLVEWGITSISVTPDVLDKTRYMVAEIEQKMSK
jgi:pyruvate,water dikinase